VLYSLRRSAVRRKVLKYLVTVPRGSYPAEIARATGLSQTQVLGALRGISGNCEKSSLTALDLVETELSGGAHLSTASIKLLQKG
jgi:predicted transcriptional regulator with HTH domain